MRDPLARPIVERSIRLLIPLLVAIGVSWVPIGAVTACSCAPLGFPDAIAESDAAFIGTVRSHGSTGQPRDGLQTVQVAFDVDRAKDAMTTPTVVDVWLGGDAGCGLDMGIGEEWLVIAQFDAGQPQTNLCSGSVLVDSMDEPMRKLVVDALDTEPVPAPNDDLPEANDGRSMEGIPLPVWLAGGAALLIAGVSVVAFRRSRSG